jgi:hypothetical protein
MVQSLKCYAPVKLTAPATKIVPITLHDTNLFDACRGLLVGTAGTANITEMGADGGAGTERTNVPLQVGYNPISVIRIKTGGTASDIWALY